MDEDMRGSRGTIVPMLMAVMLVAAGLGLMMWEDRQEEAGPSITLAAP